MFSDTERRDYLLGTRSFTDECAPVTITLVPEDGVLALSTSWPLFGVIPRPSDPPTTWPTSWNCDNPAQAPVVESPSLPIATITEEIQVDWAAMQACWINPAARKVWTIVEIDASGRVASIGPLFGGSDELQRCLTGIASEWRFPAEPGRKPACFRLDLDKHLPLRSGGDRGCVWLAMDGHTPSAETIATWGVSLDRSLDDELHDLSKRNLCPGTHVHVWGEARWQQVAPVLALLHRRDRGPVWLHFELE